MTDPYPQLAITAALGAALKQAIGDQCKPVLFGGTAAPLHGLTDLVIRQAAERALRDDLRRAAGATPGRTDQP